ncbi:MAG: plasmid recombination protein [Lachnospiraceae bacterium]|nr:plasmid recombination protein [Lachnospiraceae bacterium]
MARTISFVKGRGCLNHNNRKFISKNVDQERIALNEYFIQEPLKEAYDKCFGKALAEYNAKQKRKDRIKDDYINEIQHSGNGEKVFYENVVQIGDMNDTGIPGKGKMLPEAVVMAKEVLEKYVETFQERNPNLYVFNAVLHMDEATPHLHMDYIPVAHGYSRGLSVRNSLTKALQEQGIPKALSRERNETMFWQERERKYLKELCEERGIEIYEKGDKRESLTLPEYKKAMADIGELKEKEEELRIETAGLAEEKEELQADIELSVQARDEIIKDAEAAAERLMQAESALQGTNAENLKYALQGEYLKLAEEAASGDKDRPTAEKITGLLGNDTGYVKVENSVWKKILKILKVTKVKEKAFERMSRDMADLKDKNINLLLLAEKCREFLKAYSLYDEFMDFISPKEEKRKSIHEIIAEKKKLVQERNAGHKDKEIYIRNDARVR